MREPNRVDPLADSAPAMDPDSESYESPRLRDVGTLRKLTRGNTGVSDGLGPGSTLSDRSQSQRPGSPGAP
jgi:hypothetical protein